MNRPVCRSYVSVFLRYNGHHTLYTSVSCCEPPCPPPPSKNRQKFFMYAYLYCNCNLILHTMLIKHYLYIRSGSPILLITRAIIIRRAISMAPPGGANSFARIPPQHVCNVMNNKEPCTSYDVRAQHNDNSNYRRRQPRGFQQLLYST